MSVREVKGENVYYHGKLKFEWNISEVKSIQL